MVGFDPELSQFYARALLAVARADGEIDAGQGARLERVLSARLNSPVSFADLLLDKPLRTAEVDAIIDGAEYSMGPFRGTQIVDREELGAMFIQDALVVVGESLDVKSEAMLVRIARAFGLKPPTIAKALGR